jgi:hypothetical protein
MQANVEKWITLGLFGLPIYGALTFWASLNPQPNPDTHFAEWAQYVTTDAYVIKHVLGSALGLICAVFGTLALGAFLTRGRGSNLALAAMSVCLLGMTLFLILMGVSTFAAPMQGHAFIAGIEEFAQLPATFADTVLGMLFLGVIAFNLLGNLLLGAAIWRSGALPKWTGAVWAVAALFMYVLGIVYAVATGSQSTPPTVLVGAALVVVSGSWIAYSATRDPSAPGPTTAGTR